MRKWLYHPKHEPKLFTLKDGDLPTLRADGWVNSPADFAAVEQEAEQAPADSLAPIEQALLDAFNEDAEGLTKDELVALGKDVGVRLTRNMSEATMILKLQEQLNGDDQADN